MLHLIGLGLNEKGISKQGLEALKICKKVFLENYTIEFPYSAKDLEKVIGKKIIPAGREFVEVFGVLKEANKEHVALLIYGSPLTATTHISLLQEAKKQGIKYEIIYNASVLDAVAETGLQLYKFGKITSLPNFEAESFIEIVKDNQKINSHSLILVDIGLEFGKAVERLENVAKKHKINLDKLVVCSRLGTKENKIFYGKSSILKNKKVKAPYCFIIPGKLHFLEEEVLENFH